MNIKDLPRRLRNTFFRSRRGLTLATFLALAVGGVVLWYAYKQLASPTKILFVNFKDFQIAPFNEVGGELPVRIRHDTLGGERLSGLSGYDLVLLFGMGLRLTETQRRAITAAGEEGCALLVYGATAGADNKLTTVSTDQRKKLEKYFGYGGAANARNFLRYVRREIDGKSLFAPRPEEPIRIPQEAYFHVGEGTYFESAREYQRFYVEQGKYDPKAPRVLILSSNVGPQSAATSRPVDAVIEELERRGMNVYPASGFFRRPQRLMEVQPDVVVFIAHGRLAPGKPNQAQQLLKRLNAPLLCPVIVFETYEEWLQEQKGPVGGMFGQNIIVPEVDGGSVPYAIGAQFPNPRGLKVFKEIPQRISSFGQIVENYVRLRRTENARKKVAIVYYKGPGRNALTATGLDVVPSLLALLRHLKRRGYRTGDLPQSDSALFARIQQQGRVIGPYARGATEEFLHNGNPERIAADTLEAWMKRCLPPEMVRSLREQHGPVPGTFLSGTDSTNGKFVAVPRIRFGNVALLPQLHPGEEKGSGSFRNITFPPPYPYVGEYLWIREGFGADALIHFGTYGSFEFLPRRQPPLSRFDWPDALLGALPHLYIYCVESVGDALIAKRRSYATIITHLTPPFRQAGAYGPFRELQRKIQSYRGASSPSLVEEYRKSITRLTLDAGIEADLAIALDSAAILSDNQINRVADYVRTIATEKIHEGLHVLGEPYTEEQAIRTTIEIGVDMLSYRMAQLDALDGVFDERKLDDRAFIAEEYHSPAQHMADSILRGLAKPERYVSGQQRTRLEELKAIENPTPEQSRERLALEEYILTLEQLVPFYKDLQSSPRRELEAVVNGLNGGYIEPSTGGDPVVNPGSVPTGRNMYGVNPDHTPDDEAWRVGRQLGRQLLEKRLRENGRYPRKVAFTLWGGEFIRDRGTTVAQVLYLLGVRPVKNSRGVVHDVALLPCRVLGRPRIDVVVQTSGQFRDLASSRVHLIEKAVELATAADDEQCNNYVASGSVEMERMLKHKGYSPAEARELSTVRVFGGTNGRYGASIRAMVQSGEQWQHSDQIARHYLKNMGAMYGKERWGEYKEGVFEAALQGTEVVAQSVNSHITGPLALDNVYEFMGGLSAAVRMLTGTAPEGVFNDLRNRFDPRVRDAREMIWAEARASVLNPRYIRSMLKGGGSSYESFAETFRNCFGWSALSPDIVDAPMWRELHRALIDDVHGLGVADSFERNNPFALQEMTAVMLESARKGFWTPDSATVRKLAKRHAALVDQYKAGCSLHVCNNHTLSKMIRELVDENLAREYAEELERARLSRAERRKKALVLKKEEDRSPKEYLADNLRSILILAGIIVAFAAAVVVGKLRQGRRDTGG